MRNSFVQRKYIGTGNHIYQVMLISLWACKRRGEIDKVEASSAC
jgi:hypothetical protein